MKSSPRRAHGFTLVELLVALTISGMLLALLSQEFHMVTRQWETRFENQLEQQHLVRHVFLVGRSIEGMVPFVLFDETPRRHLTPLFSGEPDAMMWVTVNPVWQQAPALATLHISDSQQDGVAHWEYREAPLSEMFSASSEVVFGRQMLKLWPVSGQKFRYLGHATIEERLGFSAELGSTTQPPEPEWHATYEGLETQQLPRAISLGDYPDGRELLVINVPTNDLYYLRQED